MPARPDEPGIRLPSPPPRDYRSWFRSFRQAWVQARGEHRPRRAVDVLAEGDRERHLVVLTMHEGRSLKQLEPRDHGSGLRDPARRDRAADRRDEAVADQRYVPGLGPTAVRPDVPSER